MESNQEATLLQTLDHLMVARQISAGAGREAPAVAGYRLESFLGAGTFGECWAGVQLSTGQKVAVKVFTIYQSLDFDSMRQEVQKLSQLTEHPYVVTLLDANLDHQPPFLVMPLMRGSLADEEADASQYAVWFAQVCEGLGYMHGKGFLHGDLKPGNILLDHEGRARLADFGQSLKTTEGGFTLGTLGYMPPEQLQRALEMNADSPDARWDIYALGATFYRLLTGRLPRLDEMVSSSLSGAATLPDRLKVGLSSMYRRLTPVRRLNPKVDQELAALVEACLETVPGLRLPDCAAVLEDLKRREARLPLLCRRPWSPWYRLERNMRRHPAGWLAGGAVAIVLVSLLFGIWLEKQVQQTELAAVKDKSERDLESLRSEKARVKLALDDLELAMAADFARRGNLGEALLWAGMTGSSSAATLASGFPYALVGYLDGGTNRGRLYLRDDSHYLLWAPAQGAPTLLRPGPEPVDLLTTAMSIREPGLQVAAFSPDGRRLALGAGLKTLLWDLGENPGLRQVLSESADPSAWDAASAEVVDLAYTADGRLLVGDSRGRLVLYSTRGRALWNRNLGGRLQALKVGGELVAVLVDKRLELLSLRSGQTLRRFEGAVEHVDVDRTGQRVIYTGPAGTRLVEGSSGRVLSSESVPAALVVFNEQKALILGGEARVLDSRGRTQWSWQPPAFERAWVSPDGSVLCLGQGSRLRCYQTLSGQPVSGWLMHSAVVEAVSLSRDGSYLASLDGMGRIRVFRAGAGEKLAGQSLAGTRAQALLANGAASQTAVQEGSLLHVSTGTGNATISFPGPLRDWQLTSQGAFGVVGDRLYRGTQGQAQAINVPLPVHAFQVQSSWLAVASDQTYGCWPLAENQDLEVDEPGRELFACPGIRQIAIVQMGEQASPVVSSPAGVFSPQGQVCGPVVRLEQCGPGVVAAAAETVRVLDCVPRSQEEGGGYGPVSVVAELSGQRLLACAPDAGSILVIDRSHSLSVRALPKLNQVGQDLDPGVDLMAAAMSPSGKRVVAVDESGRIYYWAVPSGLPLPVLGGGNLSEPVRSVVMLSDTEALLQTGKNLVRLRLVPPDNGGGQVDPELATGATFDADRGRVRVLAPDAWLARLQGGGQP